MPVVLERECLDLSVAIEQLSEKQELLATLMEGKMRLQRVAPGRIPETLTVRVSSGRKREHFQQPRYRSID